MSGRFGWWIPMKYLLRYKMRTDQFVTNIEAPIYILHGTKDRLIPIGQSEKLVEVKPSIQLIKIPGGRHNNLPSFSVYHETVYDLLDQQPQEIPAAKSVIDK